MALWTMTGALLIVLRASARMVAQLAAPPERVLIVGPPQWRVQLAHSLTSDPGAHVEVAGFFSLEGEGQLIGSAGSNAAVECE